MPFKFFGRRVPKRSNKKNLLQIHHLAIRKNEKPNVSFKEDKGSGKKNALLTNILRMWADEESILRLSWSTVLIIILSVTVAGVFYGIEHNTKCQWNYWQCLWFVNTLFTTIGYGNLSPCTEGGRAVAVIFAIIGIPINVVALSDIGKLMARFLNFVWTSVKNRMKIIAKLCKFGKNKVKRLSKTSQSAEVSNNVVPLSLALVVSVSWFLISALYFTMTEPDNMDFGSALYFILMSVTTIGLGDVAPKQFNLVIVQFFFIVIGVALFSMLINIIQDKVDLLNDHIEMLISREYAKAQQDGVRLEATDVVAARNHIRALIKKQEGGGLLRLAMGKHMENRLVQDYMEKAKKCVTGCQTDKNTCDKEISAVQQMFDVTVGVGIFDLYPDLVTNKKWPIDGKLRKIPGQQLDWLDLMHTNIRHTKNKGLKFIAKKQL